MGDFIVAFGHGHPLVILKARYPLDFGAKVTAATTNGPE